MQTTNTRSVRTVRRALTLLVVAVGLLLGGASTALAQDTANPDPRALQVSLDGITWTQSISTPLFDPAVRWVPGDVRTASFLVRNNKLVPGDLRVVLERPVREALLDTGYLTIAARAGNGPWVDVAAGGRHVLVDTVDVDARDEMTVQLRASMDAEAPNTTMVLATDLDLDITLTQSGIVAGDDSDDDPDTDLNDGPNSGPNGGPNHGTDTDPTTGPADTGAGVLPDTGSALRPWLLPTALLLLAAGAVLVARRNDEDDETAGTLDQTLRIRETLP